MRAEHTAINKIAKKEKELEYAINQAEMLAGVGLEEAADYYVSQAEQLRRDIDDIKGNY